MKSRARKSPAVCAFDAWPEIVAHLRRASRRAIFLDFDGTLVKIQRSPRVVRSNARVNRVLDRLEHNPHFSVAIVSGRRVPDLRKLIPVRGLSYHGLHGGERDGRPLRLSKASRLALDRAKAAAEDRLASLHGVWVEDKEFSFCVHYRSADEPTARAAGRIVKQVLAPWRRELHAVSGKKIWEVLPPEIPGKFAAVQGTVGKLPRGTATVYIGDDDSDEAVFAVLKNQITIHAGSPKATHARYFLSAPTDVLRFLSRLDREFGS